MEETTETGADLLQKIKCLEAEKQKMQSEFNTQRAKLKDLFMQKESEYEKCQVERLALQRELDEMKSQFLVADLKSENEMHLKELRAQEEISSLQQLVQDTIEESTLCKTELERMKEERMRLLQENRQLRETSQHQDLTSTTPQVLSQMKKTLVRKLGGDSSGGNSDDSVRNNASGTGHVHEDAEVLHSLVEQLQEEMKALKEKLREADEKIQSNNTTKSNKLVTTLDQVEDLADITSCAYCSEMELKVQKSTEQARKYKEEIGNLEKCLQKSREDLEKEATLRKDLENQWQEKREAHKTEVQTLRDQVKTIEQKLLDLQQKFLEVKEDLIKELFKLTNERESLNKQLETLQADNEFLSGCYLETAEEIESRIINLPNNVEELHELVLRQQDDLIQARVGSEFEKQKRVTSLDEIQLLRDQLETNNAERLAYKKRAQTEIKSLQDRITEILLTLQNYEATKINLERKEVELNRQISELRVEIIELQEKNEKINKINMDYRAKIKNLQDELFTSEQVQKDFVQLSQSLQVSLETLRHADKEVRWQDDEDVDNCPNCTTFFTVTVRKIHCRHCGHIFCDKCLTKTVPSGPRRKAARVCDICYTLLNPNTAPYFSQDNLPAT